LIDADGMKPTHSPYVMPSLPIEGEAARFPIRQVYCVGRNYAAHAREMGKDPDRDPPFFFMKSVDSVVEAGTTFEYPRMTQNLHHEVELCVFLGRGGTEIAVEDALSHVYGYALGLDMTRRDLQLQARDAGRPWEFGKCFRGSAPIAPIRIRDGFGMPDRGEIWLDVNGKRRQSATLAEQLWSVAEQIAYLSNYYDLEGGDVIMTGTPAGVGAVVPGDIIRAGIDGLPGIELVVIEPARQNARKVQA